MQINRKYPDYLAYKCKARFGFLESIFTNSIKIDRCTYFYTNYENKFGDWCDFVNENCSFRCDVIDVECTKNGVIEYVFSHTQIYQYNRDRKQVFGELYRETWAPKISKDHFHPDVHVLILDSMGLFPVLRQLPETVAFLRENFKAVTFEKYTRTADDTRMNMFSALFGEIPMEVDQSLFGGGIREKTLPENHCELPLDDRNYIQFEYEDAGYKTMYAQDHFLVVFGYLRCVGIKNQLATHYMRPFRLNEVTRDDVSWGKMRFVNHSFTRTPLLKRYLRNEAHCEQLHTQSLDYTTKFLNAYPGIPKMSITFMLFAHNGELPAHRTDPDFKRFLQVNQAKLDDSILIVMGDHGQRFATVTSTEQGQFEANNPAMFFALPRKLRGTKVDDVVQKNSKVLLSHHDFYATLLDIIRYQPASNFSDTTFRRIERSFGNSWLRELDPNVARSCRNLPIASQFCTCNYGMRSIPKGDKIWKRLEGILGRDMDDHLRMAGIGHKCEKIKLLMIKRIHKMSTRADSTVYQVLFDSTTGGTFVVQYELTKEDKLIPAPANWKRLNPYGSAADCLDPRYTEYRSICFCKRPS